MVNHEEDQDPGKLVGNNFVLQNGVGEGDKHKGLVVFLKKIHIKLSLVQIIEIQVSLHHIINDGLC